MSSGTSFLKKIPGFRTRTLWKMALAIVGYFFLFIILLGFIAGLLSPTPACKPNWSCGGWGLCSIDGTQTRECADLNRCSYGSNKPIGTQKCTLTIDDLNKLSLAVNYDDLFRSNEEYVGKIVRFRGQILQVVDSDGTEFRIATGSTAFGLGYSGDIVYVNGYSGSRLLENDVVDFWGSVTDLYSYRALLGNTITVPRVRTLKMVLVSKAA